MQGIIIYLLTFILLSGIITGVTKGDYVTRLITSTVGATLYLALCIGFSFLLDINHLVAFAALSCVIGYTLYTYLIYLITRRKPHAYKYSGRKNNNRGIQEVDGKQQGVAHGKKTVPLLPHRALPYRNSHRPHLGRNRRHTDGGKT